MTLKKFARPIDRRQLGYWEKTDVMIKVLDEHGIVLCYTDDNHSTFFRGAINAELMNTSEDTELEFTKDGYFYGEEELISILRQKPNFKYNSIQLLFEDKETKATWGYATDIPHQALRIFKGNDLHCLAILFYKKDLV